MLPGLLTDKEGGGGGGGVFLTHWRGLSGLCSRIETEDFRYEAAMRALHHCYSTHRFCSHCCLDYRDIQHGLLCKTRFPVPEICTNGKNNNSQSLSSSGLDHKINKVCIYIDIAMRIDKTRV